MVTTQNWTNRFLLLVGLAWVVLLFQRGGATTANSTAVRAFSFGSNLIVNPGAESGPGSTSGNDIEPVPGWTTSGNFTVIPYGPNNGGITTTDPGPSNRGINYFAGGPSNAASSATQTINASSGATTIDAGGVTFNLSGFLGGFASQDDNAVLTITFQSAAGAALGTSHIGPVLAAERKSITGLVQRSTTGIVPRGTRSILVKLALTRTAGSYNDGYADNLSLTLTQPTSSACLAPPAGLVAWYRAEGNALDSSGKNNNGTLQSGVTYAAGKVGRAFNLDGVTNFVRVPHTPSLNFTSSFTFEGWVNPASLADRAALLEKGASINNRVGFQIAPDGSICGYFDSGTCSVTSSAGAAVAGGFTHVAFVFDDAANQARLYVNGRLVNAAPETRSPAGNTDALAIGASLANPGHNFAGRIDELSLYNRALSTAEIQAIVNAGNAGKCALTTPTPTPKPTPTPTPVPACGSVPTGLVAWYRAEGNALDSSGNGHNGTLQGGATFATGKVGRAFSFNGVNSFVQVPNSPALDPTQAATYDTWVYFNQLPSVAGRIMQILGKSGAGRDLDLQAEPDNKFHFYVAGGAPSTVVSNTIIQIGQWYHVAATYRATDRIEIYVNGKLENTTLIPGVTRQANGDPFEIGASFAFSGRFFSGRIDEAALYNRALSAAEIKANYIAGSSGQCAGSASPGITVTPTSGLVTTEAGGKATFTVKLSSQPKANVTIGLKSSNPSNGTVLPVSLTFTSANWNTAQTVTVTGVKDTAHTPREPYTIITAPAISTDTQYNGLNAPDVQVTNLDNTGQPTITLTPTTATVRVGQQQQFIATVTGLGKVTVNWRVQESGSSGTISETGLYTAPQVPGRYHVVATVVSHPELTATAVVNVGTPTSALRLSNGQADSTQDIVTLNFVDTLDAVTAADVERYTVIINGHAVKVESAAYDAAKHRVLLSLADGALQVGDKVVVNWSNLWDANGNLAADGKVSLVAR